MTSFHSSNVEIIRFPHYIKDSKGEIPSYATPGSAAIDLYACNSKNEPTITIKPGQNLLIPSGIALNIKNQNIAAVVLPRSGLGHKEGIVLGNLVGLIDSDYQGEIMISIWNRNKDRDVMIDRGMRIAQLMFIPVLKPNFIAVEEFSSKTERGSGGFGSTGV